MGDLGGTAAAAPQSNLLPSQPRAVAGELRRKPARARGRRRPGDFCRFLPSPSFSDPPYPAHEPCSLVPGVGPSILRADGRRLPDGWWRHADLLVLVGSARLATGCPDPCADMVDSPGSGVEAARAASGQAMRGVFPSWLLLLPAVGLWRQQTIGLGARLPCPGAASRPSYAMRCAGGSRRRAGRVGATPQASPVLSGVAQDFRMEGAT
uniref:Uncharacterized protein n=1 Tax=Setaria italica TaxID=4555 RepID=K3YA22_SETIT